VGGKVKLERGRVIEKGEHKGKDVTVLKRKGTCFGKGRRQKRKHVGTKALGDTGKDMVHLGRESSTSWNSKGRTKKK